jgi:hypothetical protein
MKEALAHAMNSSDLEAHEWDCSLDKLHALGITAINNDIGTLAIRFIDAGQAKSYKQLVYALAKKASIEFKCSRDMMNKLSEQAVKEAVFPFCRACQGRGEVNNGEKVHVCPSCNGSRYHAHSDLERANAIGVDIEAYHKGWAKRYQIVQGIFNDKYASAVRNARNIIKGA